MANRMVLQQSIDVLFNVIQTMVFIRVLLSWFPIAKNGRIVTYIYQVTDPILVPVKNMLEKSAIGRSMYVDFSPIVALLLLSILRNILIYIIK